jgi:hypothetical protein
MKIAGHQPNYIPWPGYFVKMAQCDIFFILDTAQFQTGSSLDNRNLIKTSQGTQMLTVPVKRKGMGLQRFNEVIVIPGWKKNHLMALQVNYAKAPYFEKVFPLMDQVLQDTGYLVDTNIAFIRLVHDLLGLKTKLVYISDLPQFADLRKNELIAAICRYFSADCYLSGIGARTYNQPEIFEKQGIKLEYLDYQPITYPQLWGSFIPNLSIIDMLFNCGAEGTRKLLLSEVQA